MYENTMKRTFKILAIITTEDNLFLMKPCVYKWIQQIELNKHINIEVFSEEDIEKEN